MVTRKLLLEFKVLFPDENYHEYIQLLNSIPQKTIIDFVSTFLRYRVYDPQISDLQTFLGNWFNKNNEEYANEVLQRIRENEIKLGYKYIIINEITNLLIFEAGFSNSVNELPFSTDEFEIQFFKIYLAFNQKHTKDEHLAGDSTKHLENPYRSNALLLSSTISISDLTVYNLKDSLVTQTAKAISFFEYISVNPIFEQHLAEFYQQFEIKDFKEFVKEYLFISSLIVKTRDEGKIDFTIPKDDENIKRRKFLESFAIDLKDIEDDVDFKEVRNNPIVQIEVSKFRVIFPLLVIEKLYSGLYFKFKEINDSLSKELKISDIRGVLTFGFSEKYLFYNLMKRIYQNRYIQKSGNEIEVSGIEGFTDYYLRNGNKVFLFESKDILINARIKQTYEFDKIETELKKKLYYEDQNGKIERKAISQLIYSIKILLDEDFGVDKNYKPHKIRVYPIIILHNRQLETLGVNRILIHWWRDEIDRLRKESYPVERIKDPVIINIDSLILYSDELSRKRIRLEDMIDTYLEFTDQDKFEGRKFKDDQEVQTAFQNSCIPFTEFVNNNYSRALPSIFEEMGLSLF